MAWQYIRASVFDYSKTYDYFKRIEDNKIIITFASDIAFGSRVSVMIPSSAVTDMSGNPLEDFLDMTFWIEEEPAQELDIISSIPEDGSRDVMLNTEISFTYNMDNILKSTTFESISMLETGAGVIPVTTELYGDTVRLEPESGGLDAGKSYEIYVPTGAVRDRYGNISKAKVIRFSTVKEDLPPGVSRTYPANGAEKISVNQSVVLEFSEIVKWENQYVRLQDENGSIVPSKKVAVNHNGKTSVRITPIEPLKPSRTYEVLIEGSTVRDLSDNYLAPFSMSFMVDGNPPDMEVVNLKDGQTDVAINTRVELEFSSPVNRGAQFDNIKITAPDGNSLSFDSQESGSSGILIPAGNPESGTRYSLYIPAGAYTNDDNQSNDAYRMEFTTAHPVEISPNISFTASPSLNYVHYAWIDLDAGLIDTKIRREGLRRVTQYEWDFGDGNNSSSKYVRHMYNQPGEYEIILKMTDDKGFTYEFKQNATIKDYFDSLDINVAPAGAEEGELSARVVTRDNSSNTIMYNVEITGNFTGGGYTPVADHNVDVYLYKNNRVIEEVGRVTTDSRGRASLDFNYEGLTGTYELGFNYLGYKSVRCPLTVDIGTSRRNLNILVYNEDVIPNVSGGEHEIEFLPWYPEYYTEEEAEELGIEFLPDDSYYYSVKETVNLDNDAGHYSAILTMKKPSGGGPSLIILKQNT